MGFIRVLVAMLRHPINFLCAYFVDHWAKRTMIPPLHVHARSHLRLRLGAFGLTTALAERAMSFIAPSNGGASADERR